MNTEVIKKIPMFSSLNEEDLMNILRISKEKTYDKGETIFFDTEPYHGFYIVLQGLVKIFKISKDGKEHILHIVGQNNSFAEVPLLENFGSFADDNLTYPANSMALEDSTKVMMVSAKPFLSILEKDNKLCLKMVSGFAKRLRILNHHIEDLALKDVTRRVAGFILTEYSIKNKTNTESKPLIKLNISKNDLAAYLGTIIETLSRTFKKMHDEGIIEVDGKTILIKNLESLKKQAS